MRKRHIIFIIIFSYVTMKGQLPYTYSSSGNTTLTSGITNIYASYVNIGVSTYNVASSAQLDVIASNQIRVQGEFKATNLSSNGNVHLHIAAQSFDVASFHTNGFTGIPKYDKFELGIKLPASVQAQIDTFINDYDAMTLYPALNPYDPDQIMVKCIVHPPSGNVFTRYGFYYQPYTVVNNTYIEGTTEYPFRIRMAPPEVGQYYCEISVYMFVNGSFVPALNVSNINFSVVNSNNPGHLTVDATLQKMKFLDSGTPFFGIGVNMPGPIYAVNNVAPYYSNPSFPFAYGPNAKASPATHDIHRSYLTDMGNKGANFARIRLDPWSYPIESSDVRHGAAGSYGVNRYVDEKCFNNYQHNQMFLAEFDKTLELCEDPNKRMYIMLNIFNDGITNGADGLCDWSRYPYSLLTANVSTGNPGNNDILSFFTHPFAKAAYKKQLAYIANRWGYSTSIALWEMINETENIKYYKSTDIDYLPAIEPAVKNWVCEMKQFLDTRYPKHLGTNGTTLIQFNSTVSCLDVYSRNFYSNEVDPPPTNDHKNAKDNLHEAGAFQFANQKPFLWGELGLGSICNPATYHSSTYNGFTEDRFLDGEIFNDRNFHNNLWATTVSGNVATGLNWIGGSQTFHTSNFPALKKFSANIPWNIKLIPYHITGTRNETVGTNPADPLHRTHIIDNLYMVSANQEYAVGWSMINTSFWAYDKYDDNGNYFFQNYWDMTKCAGYENESNIIDYDISLNSSEPPVEIKGMKISHRYRIEIFDTYYSTTNTLSYPVSSDASGVIRFHLSFTNHNKYDSNHNLITQYIPDRAYIVHDDAGAYWPSPQQGKSSQVEDPYENDIIVQYAADIGTNADGSTTNFKKDTIEVQKLIIFPNPASNQINISYNELYFTNVRVTLYNLAGKMVGEASDAKSINTQGLEEGLYIVTFRSDQAEKSFKISIIR